eukprot:1188167-Prorocentrum_minimum.AAC.7
MGGGRGEPSRTRARVHLGLLEEPRVQEAQVYSHNGPIRHGKRRCGCVSTKQQVGERVSYRTLGLVQPTFKPRSLRLTCPGGRGSSEGAIHRPLIPPPPPPAPPPPCEGAIPPTR